MFYVEGYSLDEFFKGVEIIFDKSNSFDSLLTKIDLNIALPIEIPFEDVNEV